MNKSPDPHGEERLEQGFKSEMTYEQVQEAVRAYKGVDLVRESSPKAGMFDLRHHSRQGRSYLSRERWKV